MAPTRASWLSWLHSRSSFVPRPLTVVVDTLRAIHNAPATLFEPGDLIQFEDAACSAHSILILDIRSCGRVDAAVYQGRPNYLGISLGDLLKLRIVRVERMDEVNVAMHRTWLKLDEPTVHGQARAERLEVAA